jgi:hypothetical protein
MYYTRLPGGGRPDNIDGIFKPRERDESAPSGRVDRKHNG